MNGVLEKIKKEKMIIIYFVSLLILMLVITGCAGGLDEPSAKNTALPSESSIEETRTVSPTIPETVPKSTPAPTTQTLDEVVTGAILEHNKDKFPANNEAYGEGHIIMDTVQDGEIVTVYALTMYGSYQFQDGNFVKNGGSGGIPAVIQIRDEDNGVWKLENYEEPLDGGLYGDSIRSMFPEELWKRCIAIREEDLKELKRQEQSYAMAYLKTIEREAEIGDYSDFPHTIPSEVGISTEVSNKIDEARKYGKGPLAYAPFWFGTVEQVENGVRYLYEQRYDAEQKEILFSKIVYDSQEVVEQMVFDSYTGEQK